MSLENGRERLERAVGILVDEKDRIKERLLVAYASQLSRIHRTEDLPEHLIGDFAELKNAVSDAEMPYGFGENASKKIKALSEDEASRYARTIYSMFLRNFELATHLAK